MDAVREVHSLNISYLYVIFTSLKEGSAEAGSHGVLR